jgi:LmbE family N-acetylglucosaminyl deacetylase
MYHKDIQNVLVIGAHFDDIEFGCAGTIVKLLKQHKKVYSLILTDSGWSSVQNVPVRTSDVAIKEGLEAYKILGTELIDFKRKKTCELLYNDELIVSILKIIESYNIDTVFTHWIHDVHQDHYATAKATITACKHVPRVLMYQSNYYDSNQPFNGNFYFDISEEFPTKVKAIECFKSEMNRTKGEWKIWLENSAKYNGMKIGCAYAESFEIIKYTI